MLPSFAQWQADNSFLPIILTVGELFCGERDLIRHTKASAWHIVQAEALFVYFVIIFVSIAARLYFTSPAGVCTVQSTASSALLKTTSTSSAGK